MLVEDDTPSQENQKLPLIQKYKSEKVILNNYFQREFDEDKIDYEDWKEHVKNKLIDEYRSQKLDKSMQIIDHKISHHILSLDPNQVRIKEYNKLLEEK